MHVVHGVRYLGIYCFRGFFHPSIGRCIFISMDCSFQFFLFFLFFFIMRKQFFAESLKYVLALRSPFGLKGEQNENGMSTN